MSELFASVHILDVPFHADCAYDYYVPSELRECGAVGKLVQVPYGTANRKVAAVITTLKDTTTLENLKPILSVAENGSELNDEMLALCDFMKEHTLCTIGDAVRTILPTGAIAKSAVYFRVAPNADPSEKLEKLGDKAAFLYSFVAARDKVSLARLRTEFGDESANLAGSLEKAGLILKETVVRENRTERYRRFYSLHSSLRDDPELLASALHRQRSPLQADILRILSKNPEMLQEDLCAVTGTSGAQISSLLKKGLITERLENDFRNPFLHQQTPPDVGSSPLSEEQETACRTLNNLYESGEAKAALLHGVTGSGKTRVILSMIDRVLRDHRSVIVLVPEISLTPQMVGIFLSRYGERIAVIHSSLSAGERYDAWRRIRDGLADVVIGTRSAVFAPVTNLGMLVIDEEQEHTYKSDANPKYSAHDIARFRCAHHHALMLLASATPSVVSYYRAMTGHYTLVEMKKRYGKATLPHVIVTDMRGEPGGGTLSPLSGTLRQQLLETVSDGKQAIVFLNRRGYNNFISCRTCGEVLKCPNCSVSLTYHVFRPLGNGSGPETAPSRSENGVLTCHYCGYRTRVPTVCPSCKSEHFHFRGYGTQLLEDELSRLTPSPRVIRMDMDTTQTKFSHEELITQFRSHNADILLGTQMVAKGHDFPDVTLVGVINADSSLYLDDYRASERTFSMLTQVIGRAGRADKPGTAIVQTFNPTNDILTLAANQDYPEFYRREIKIRQSLVFPPFCDLAVITLASRNEALLASATVRMREWIREAVSGTYADLKMVVFGPFEAPVYKIQGVCRNRMVIKCRLNRRSRAFIAAILTEFGRNAGKRMTISADLNPNTL